MLCLQSCYVAEGAINRNLSHAHTHPDRTEAWDNGWEDSLFHLFCNVDRNVNVHTLNSYQRPHALPLNPHATCTPELLIHLGSWIPKWPIHHSPSAELGQILPLKGVKGPEQSMARGSMVRNTPNQRDNEEINKVETEYWNVNNNSGGGKPGAGRNSGGRVSKQEEAITIQCLALNKKGHHSPMSVYN